MCCISLQTGEGTSLVGSSPFRSTLMGLLEFLEERSESPPARHPDGIDWQHILSTSSPHQFIFGRKSGPNGFELKVWNGKPTSEPLKFPLGRAEAREWIELLSNWLKEEYLLLTK
jgi:hypothetical protein